LRGRFAWACFTAAFAIFPFLFFAPTAFGQNRETLELSVFGGGSFFGHELANGGTVGGRAAYNFTQHFALEGSYSFAVNNARLFGNRVNAFSIDPVYNFLAPDSLVRPYLTAGVGPTWFDPRNSSAISGLSTSSEFAFNYGGGVKVHLNPHFGLRLDARGTLSENPKFGIAALPSTTLNGFQATLGLVYYSLRPHLPAPAPTAPPKPTLQPLNPGEITGASGPLCEGRVLTLHATATDPAGHPLTYAWKVNGQPAGSNNPDLSYKPNNAGDFEFEVEVSDAGDAARSVRIGPKTLAIQDYVLPKIASLAAVPNVVNLSSDAASGQTIKFTADVAASACGGNLTYQWKVSEGKLTNDAGASAIFDTASLSFEPGAGQTKTITATVTATDENGKSASQSANVVINYPALYKRLPDIIFAKDSARVNNCGKRILLEQAAPQAGAAFDILLVGHISADESSMLDQKRVFNAAAVLTGRGGSCASLEPSQVRFNAAGTGQVSAPDPGLCGTSNIPPTAERRGATVSEADKERRVEVYLVPKDSQVLPAAAKQAATIQAKSVKALGCPK
jgi:hypothetical protein